ncbi:MAG: peptidoglycan-binding protein [Candidatus Omnitrophica bacterium]|nr:peptidoglycan-binding protein [Candidatus Omnitrophota bacterium]MBU1047956.1 peptidoglycan-binding protein [Candidatus Omnitrophota bacterium]MBU1889761.1 peptidoglycan-binding protein [Candidatus Omnitrophota bacterium]
MQTALKNAGFYKGPIDGKLGKQTQKAIVQFQKANGLKADGVIGEKTTAALSQYLK